MALIPGSYARAAGLQSEINKVTITRVAGSEVQFRRTIDTYQRDLRYNVNQIGREQRQLKRSMRKYMKKLHDSKKERKQRADKARKDSHRLKLNAKQFQEAERAVKSNKSLTVTSPNTLMASDAAGDDVSLQGGFADPGGNAKDDQQDGAVSSSTLPDSPDSGLGGDCLEDPSSVDPSQSHPECKQDDDRKRRLRKAFLTSNKGTVPYFKAKMGPASKGRDERHAQKLASGSNDDQADPLKKTSNHDALLPVICEESEDVVDQNKLTPTRTPQKETGTPVQPDSSTSDPISENGDTDSPKASVSTRPKLTVVASLDTKAFCKPGDSHAKDGSYADTAADNSVRRNDNTGRQGVPEGDADTAGMTWRQRKPRRKTGVSYADLIKLQHSHTSSSKQLFRLVDRLASVHGIVDPQPLPASSRSSSLDPRTNVKIKQRGNGPESQMSDGMVRQAAVLYSMKYGYGIPDHVSLALHDDPLPVFVSLQLSPDDARAEDRDKELGVVTDRHWSKRDSVSGVSDVTSRKLSVASVRRNSTDVTSPFYEFSEAASSVFDDIISNAVSTALNVPPERRASRSRSRQALSLTQLSQKASEVRERTFQEPSASHGRSVTTEDSPGPQTDSSPDTHRDSRSPHKVPAASPAPRRSRSLSRSRRDSVNNQLQRRLNEDGEGSHMQWQSAFGRLKMLHTLYDLSQHFTKDTK